MFNLRYILLDSIGCIGRFVSRRKNMEQLCPRRRWIVDVLFLALALEKLRRGFGRVERACRRIGLAEH